MTEKPIRSLVRIRTSSRSSRRGCRVGGHQRGLELSGNTTDLARRRALEVEGEKASSTSHGGIDQTESRVHGSREDSIYPRAVRDEKSGDRDEWISIGSCGNHHRRSRTTSDDSGRNGRGKERVREHIERGANERVRVRVGRVGETGYRDYVSTKIRDAGKPCERFGRSPGRDA